MNLHLQKQLGLCIPATLLLVFIACTPALADDDDDDEGVSGHCNRVLLLRYDAESGMPQNVSNCRWCWKVSFANPCCLR